MTTNSPPQLTATVLDSQSFAVEATRFVAQLEPAVETFLAETHAPATATARPDGSVKLTITEAVIGDLADLAGAMLFGIAIRLAELVRLDVGDFELTTVGVTR